MIYYRVKDRYDGKHIYKKCFPDEDLLQKIELIGGELYTTKERNMLLVKDSVFDIIDIPKKDTFYSFGVRFAVKEVI